MQTTRGIRIVTKQSVDPVSELDVTKLQNLRESKAFLKKRLEQIESELDSVETELIERIEAGAQITCRYPVSIKTSERRCPSWKDAFIQVAGESEAKRIIESTRPTVSKSVVISMK